MAYRMASSPVPAAAPVRPPPPPVAENAVPVPVAGRSSAVGLRYTGEGSVRVVGPVTGRGYVVSAERPEFAVDPRDAAVLVRQGMFRRM